MYMGRFSSTLGAGTLLDTTAPVKFEEDFLMNKAT